MNKEKFKSFFQKKENKIKLVVIIGVIGIMLIFASDVIPSGTKDTKCEKGEYTYNWDDYKNSIEKDLTDTISAIDGVGNCKVMITLDESNEYVYAKNTKSSVSNEEQESEEEYVTYEKSGDDSPVLLKEYFPKIKGVVVVCDGGDDIGVKESVTESVSALFDLPSNKISITKINSEKR